MWVPANDIEQHMREALRAGQQEEYFRLLARTELLLPFADETSPSSNGTGSWATWATEERTHVLVFTSPEAMQACLHAHAGAYRSVNFGALAEAWPDSEWWLAVDPGTPIEGYLPAWFVRQVANGEINLPEEPQQPQAPPNAPPDYQQAPGGGFGHSEGSAFSEPFSDHSPRYGESAPSSTPGPGGLPRRGTGGAESGGLPRREGGPQNDSSAWNTGGESGGLPSREPAPPADAFASTSAWDYPPASDPYAPPAARNDQTGPIDVSGYDSGQGWDQGGQSSSWDPQPQPQAQPAAASPPPLPVPMSTSLPAWPSEDEIDEGLAQAAASGDTQAFLNVLLRAWAYLPVAEDCPPSARPGDPEFRWHTDLIDGAYTITAFTSLSRLNVRYGDRPHINTTFGRLTAQWPGLEYSLYVNPSTEIGANIPGPQVTTLVTWARTQNLLQPALDMDALGSPTGSTQADSAPAASYPPAPTYVPDPAASYPPAPTYVPDPAASYSPAPTPAPAERPQEVTPSLMQKVVPHQQVAMTLERGYDRVAGFVHRFDEVSDLNTPERLYNSLGLLRDGTDFSPADDSVHVVRWIGHRTDLYRVAYGGNDAMTADRNGGWIVEPPPFSGDGYAPSVEGRRIVEYKADSVRLPHGATMTRIGADGRADEIAVYDSDRREWIRSGVESAASSWDISPVGDFRQEQQHA